jgi:predicted AAA+ superfamily ATPase
MNNKNDLFFHTHDMINGVNYASLWNQNLALGIYMYRKEQDKLDEWWQKPHRKPLVIRGARQVGKSTLVRLFAASKGLSLNEVNLDRYPLLDAVFVSKDTQKIIAELESLPKMPGISPDSLLFLDEIQGVESVLPALRYFYEDRPELPVVAAGSLLEFLLRDHEFSMPVGRVEYLQMGPLVFSEFLMALKETNLQGKLKNFRLKDELGDLTHQRFIELLRTYFFVGGMPEAVDQFVKTGKQRAASEVHQSILGTFQDDFPKYIGSRNVSRFLKVFAYSARNIGLKVKYTNFSTDHQSSTIKADIDLLSLARILNKVTHSHCNGLPLEAERDENVYKLMFLDIGLMNSMLGLSWKDLTALPELKLVNEGALAEQFVGQHLLDAQLREVSSGLSYWLREGKGVNAEVDFVSSAAGQIFPIEVKSGASGSLRSLHQFMGEKQLNFAIRLDLNPPSLQWVETMIQSKAGPKKVRYRLLSLPLYLVEKIPEIAAAYFHGEIV